MQVKVVPGCEFKVHLRCLEECDAAAIGHRVKAMQNTGFAPGLGGIDGEGVNQWQSKEIFIESPGFLGVPASISGMVQLPDSVSDSHVCSN
jgi:hypothetical protein